MTPIDREDIHALVRALDDVIDDIDASADMLRLYRIEHVRPAARELSRAIVSAGRMQSPGSERAILLERYVCTMRSAPGWTR